MRYITKLDFVGTEPQLFIQKEVRHQTFVGGLLSIAVGLCALATIGYFGREMWEKSNPIVNRALEIVTAPSNLTLDKHNWDFFFGLQYNNSLYIDNSIYTVKARTFINKQATGLIPTNFNIEPCTNNSFYPDTYAYFQTYKIAGAWCISKNQNITLQLNKLWGQEDFSYIEISLWPCINSTDLSKQVCKPLDEINLKLRTATFSVYTMHYYISTKNYESPYVVSIFNDFYPVSYSTFTQSIIFFMHSQTTSDAGWLLDDPIDTFKFSLDRAKLNFYANNEADGRFLRFQYQLSNIKEVYNRKYMKLQELCAQIGGITKFLIICGMILNYFLAEFALKVYLVNEFFDCEIKKEDITESLGAKPEKLYSERTNFNTARQKSSRSTKLGQADLGKKTYDEDFKLIESMQAPPSIIYLPQRRKLEFSIFERAFSCLYTTANTKFAQLMYSFSLLKNQLSVENLLENTRSISKLRYFLLSPYENDMFDYIGNPLNGPRVHSESISRFDKLMNFMKSHNQVIENKIISYDQKTMFKLNFNSRALTELVEAYNSRPFSLKHDTEVKHTIPPKRVVSEMNLSPANRVKSKYQDYHDEEVYQNNELVYKEYRSKKGIRDGQEEYSHKDSDVMSYYSIKDEAPVQT